jgi:hypothetical protein
LTNTATFTGNFLGSASVTYNASDVAVPNFTASPAYMVPQNVKIISYSP